MKRKNLIPTKKNILKKNHKKVNQIEKVFNAASHKKVWDHFTKPQRKNIDQWCKQASVCMQIVLLILI